MVIRGIYMTEKKFEEDVKEWGFDIAYDNFCNKGGEANLIYKKAALLAASNYSLSDALHDMGIDRIDIYGCGEIGNMIYQFVRDGIVVDKIYDKKLAGQEIFGKTIDKPEIIFESCNPILITPANLFREISTELIANGVNRKRLLSVNLILSMAIRHINSKEKFNMPKYDNKFVLVTGAGFHNSGAQAMMFTIVSELRKKNPNIEFFILGKGNALLYESEYAMNCRMYFLKGEWQLYSELFEAITMTDIIVDISGYQLSSDFPKFYTEMFLQYFRLSKFYKIPIYVMPQSFGPLNFDRNYLGILKNYMSNAEVIFARETDGYRYLTEELKLGNVKMAIDCVLQSTEIVRENIYYDLIHNKFGQKANAVALVPNTRCFDFADKNRIIYLYIAIAQKVLNLGHQLYIVPHSEDEELCKVIYDYFKGNDKVCLIEKQINCIDFSEFIKDVEYVIASRYHSIIHSYKEGIPCFILGWAVKYKEVAELFGQGEYVFDICSGDESTQTICDKLEEFDKCYLAEKDKIRSILPRYQVETVFESILL